MIESFSGTPRKFRLSPGKFAGVPEKFGGTPGKILGVPRNIPGDPGKIPGTPRELPGIPGTIAGVPAKIVGIPKKFWGIMAIICSATQMSEHSILFVLLLSSFILGIFGVFQRIFNWLAFGFDSCWGEYAD